MFRNWGAWLGIEPENSQVKGGEQAAAAAAVAAEKDGSRDINKPSAGAGGEQTSCVKEDRLLQQATGLSGESASNFTEHCGQLYPVWRVATRRSRFKVGFDRHFESSGFFLTHYLSENRCSLLNKNVLLTLYWSNGAPPF